MIGEETTASCYERLVTMSPINNEKLEKLAELSVNTGVGLQRGQNLLITAPSDALPLERLIAKHAYKAGAGLVTPVSYTHLRAHET